MLDTFKIKVYLTIYLIITLLIMSMLHYCSTGETDSIYEELAEDIIEEATGIDVDFSR